MPRLTPAQLRRLDPNRLAMVEQLSMAKPGIEAGRKRVTANKMTGVGRAKFGSAQGHKDAETFEHCDTMRKRVTTSKGDVPLKAIPPKPAKIGVTQWRGSSFSRYADNFNQINLNQ